MFCKKIGAWLLAVFMLVTVFSGVVMAKAEGIEIILTDITEGDVTTLSGEAKIKVSVKGAQGEVSIAQVALSFDGDLKYKSIEFLKGENNPSKGNAYIMPNAAAVNMTGEINTSIICAKTPMEFDDEEDLFILTFTGEAGDEVEVTTETDGTYCTVDGSDRELSSRESITAAASAENAEGKEAVVSIVMDGVKGFSAGDDEDYSSSNVTLTIESQDTKGYIIYTVLNNILVSKGGHRENTTVPTFTVVNTVLADEEYTVTVSGLGYVDYVVKNVDFDDVLEITNEEFIPGDVIKDNKVDEKDIEKFDSIVEADGYSESADFNRDGKVNRYDREVFEGVEAEAKLPKKMDKPDVEGGKNKITVEWTVSKDKSVTGYVIKYGTSKANLNKEVEIKSADTDAKTISDLDANKTYYVAIAAVNEAGTGEFSDTASATTDKADDGGGTGGGGTGGGGTGGGGTGGGNTNTDTGNTNKPADDGKVFKDLGNHTWAEEFIYKLYENKIISGVSATEFAPANNIKRGDFILILTRMLGIDEAFDTNFADVPAGSYYYHAIGSAKAAGIAKGSGENFMPEASITRQDLITLAYRAFLDAGYIEETEDMSVLDQFGDKDAVADYAKAAMASMVSAGIIKGSDGNVNPTGNATRAEVAVMCARLFDLMN